jgi:phosphoglycerate dehydrogenase-like enzyme
MRIGLIGLGRIGAGHAQTLSTFFMHRARPRPHRRPLSLTFNCYPE